MRQAEEGAGDGVAEGGECPLMAGGDEAQHEEEEARECSGDGCWSVRFYRPIEIRR